MEEKYYDPNENISLGNIKKSTLLGIAKWAKFLSIVSFITIGITAISIVAGSFMMPNMSEQMANQYNYMYISGDFSWLYAIIYFIILAVYFLLVLFLFQFASKVEKALTSDVTYSSMQDGFESLRKYFLIKGILVVIGLIFFIISIIGIVMTLM
jgi:amino acid transporter